ncbi:uncharacterized protein A4U43_C04F14790 [Asparagus officinalis]|uniref:Nodulin-like domain-containing protein n=1 Tax=Asparagus officinalis TaxID=4686 RepID=A0A5P1F0X8_ASPOF|nr:uncharacterized protein A4U43_C04F14790 [Asparagus officinalis]
MPFREFRYSSVPSSYHHLTSHLQILRNLHQGIFFPKAPKSHLTPSEFLVNGQAPWQPLLLLLQQQMGGVCLCYVECCAGTGYLFGSFSPVIKSSLGYNQRQMCILIFIGCNGETYFSTATLVSCVHNFPCSRGPVVGILKGFAGLSGAILTQIYATIHTPNHATLIFMIAVRPAMIVIALMFFVRPVGGHKQVPSSDNSSFVFIHSACLLLAAYLMVVMLLEDLIDLSHSVAILLTVVLLFLLLLPAVIPLILTFCVDDNSLDLLAVPQKEEACESEESSPQHKALFSRVGR